MLGNYKLNPLLLSMLTVLFVFGVYTMAVAFTSDGGTPFIYEGTIIGYDPADRMLTVREGPNAEHLFVLTDRVEIVSCDMNASIDDLKVGDMVKLGYSDESNGTRIVSWIDLEDARC